jgi:hypothetical protein
MKTDAQIIDELGGTTTVAADLQEPETTVSSWKKNGIPRWRRQPLIDLAQRKNVPLCEADFPKRERRRPTASAEVHI